MIPAFYRCCCCLFFFVVFLFFLKVYKICLLLVVALPGLIDLLFNICQFESFSRNVFAAETKVLDTKVFPQHTIADLNSRNIFIVLLSQEKPIR